MNNWERFFSDERLEKAWGRVTIRRHPACINTGSAHVPPKSTWRENQSQDNSSALNNKLKTMEVNGYRQLFNYQHPNVFFCAQQKKETHASLGQLEGE